MFPLPGFHFGGDPIFDPYPIDAEVRGFAVHGLFQREGLLCRQLQGPCSGHGLQEAGRALHHFGVHYGGLPGPEHQGGLREHWNVFFQRALLLLSSVFLVFFFLVRRL